MKPRWKWPEHTLPTPEDRAKLVQRYQRCVNWIGLAVGILLLLLFYVFRARGQEYHATNNPEFIPIGEVHTNQAARRVAQPMVPPLPVPRKITRTVTTNSEMERVSVTIEKLPDPPALKLPKKPSWTNSFWVRCGADPGCEEEAIRKPRRMQMLGSVSLPDQAYENEYAILFWCDECQQEFTAKYLRRITRPVAVPVTVPVK